MEDQFDSGLVFRESSWTLGSDSKSFGEKRRIYEFEEKNDEFSHKLVKMRDLGSLSRSDEITAHLSKFSEEVQSTGGETSQIYEVPLASHFDASPAEIRGKDSLPVQVKHVSQSLDLNAHICMENNSGAKNPGKQSLQGKCEKEHEKKYMHSKALGLDLDEDVSSSVNYDLCHSSKSTNVMKRRDVSECGSSIVPLENRDPLSVWKEMKQNGFLSSSYEGVSLQTSFLSSSRGGMPIPKRLGRKTGDALKKRMELAKKEQVDRFTEIAAPSGLLNGLNPGIINHVRNRKQVHSIIEALVRSEKLENSELESKQARQNKGATKTFDNKNEQEISGDFVLHRVTHSLEDASPNTIPGVMQKTGFPPRMHKSFSLTAEEKSGDGDASMVETVSEYDGLELKLSSSSARAFENTSSLSHAESANFACASSLSVKAANVASQWLELLHQDIKGRLLALRRSKKRVRDVITTELPFLIAQEFSYNLENDPSVMKNSFDGFSSKVNVDMHRAKWSELFDQMDKALSEEERQLEGWLKQIKEMQLHCDQGLQPNMVFDSQQMGAVRTDTRSSSCKAGKIDNSEKELAVRAAAASIYSTCNFLLSMDNVPCF